MRGYILLLLHVFFLVVFILEFNSATKCMERERHALLVFKQGLEDDYGMLSSWKEDPNADCCKWKGVQCNNETGFVQRLDLHGSEAHSLSGKINPSIAELQHLTHLDLSYLYTRSDVPKLIGSLSNLQYLNLSYGGYVGQIPYQLGNLSQLQVLDITSNNLVGAIPFQLGNLSQLQYLYLQGNNLVGAIPFQLGNLSRMQDLHLGSNRLVGAIPFQLGNLSQLRRLNLYSNRLVGAIPLQLGNLSQLQHLDLANNRLVGAIPSQLGNLSQLQYLGLSHNNLVGAIPSQLGNLSQLGYLDLSSNYLVGVIPFQLENLQQLQYLVLSNNPLVGEIPFQLGNLSMLQTLRLFNNSLVGAIPYQLGNLSLLQYLDLGLNRLVGAIPFQLGNLSQLRSLKISRNKLVGAIPFQLGNICTLQEFSAAQNRLSGELSTLVYNSSKCIGSPFQYLDLWDNQFHGTLPDLSIFTSLNQLTLNDNQLTGEIPTSLGSLEKLKYLDLSGNYFDGVISESHFANLSRLEVLVLARSHNLQTMKVSTGWVPPFQLRNLNLAYSNLDSKFPNWLQTQNNLNYLDISNVRILDPVPQWFWGKLQTLRYMNISNNNLTGTIPNLELVLTQIPLIDLTSNQFEGSIPLFLLQASALHLSNNKFSDIVAFVCGKSRPATFDLEILDVSNNQLRGELPDCWNNLNSLKFVDLSSNKLWGEIPFSMGTLADMKALILRNNSLTGQPPPSLKNCSKLVWLELGENKFHGPVPLWIGESLQQLAILSLRNNYFYGSLPSDLCFLSKLQVLDLSLNNLSGEIPTCVKNFTSMAQDTTSSAPLMDRVFVLITIGWYYYYAQYDLYLFLTWKGVNHGFKNADRFLKGIDLSSNRLTGEIPTEVGDLFGLVSLNLSRNNLSGEIISKIGNLKSLEFLDLSRNNLSGRIPSSLAQIDRLTMLDLSSNQLYGKIPTGTQLQSFNASSFERNFNLCGEPLDRKCPEDPREHQKPPMLARDDNSEFLEALYMSLGLGFFTGFCGFIGTILILPSWRDSYGRFLNALIFRFCMCWKQ